MFDSTLKEYGLTTNPLDCFFRSAINYDHYEAPAAVFRKKTHQRYLRNADETRVKKIANILKCEDLLCVLSSLGYDSAILSSLEKRVQDGTMDKKSILSLLYDPETPSSKNT